jgi:hypothetical protein
MWIRCRGLGKSVPGKLALVGQTAAHGQITERKYSVAQFRFLIPGGSEPCLRNDENSLILPP